MAGGKNRDRTDGGKDGLFIRGLDSEAIYQQVNRPSNVPPAPVAATATLRKLRPRRFGDEEKYFSTFQTASRGGHKTFD